MDSYNYYNNDVNRRSVKTENVALGVQMALFKLFKELLGYRYFEKPRLETVEDIDRNFLFGVSPSTTWYILACAYAQDTLKTTKANDLGAYAKPFRVYLKTLPEDARKDVVFFVEWAKTAQAPSSSRAAADEFNFHMKRALARWDLTNPACDHAETVYLDAPDREELFSNLEEFGNNHPPSAFGEMAPEDRAVAVAGLREAIDKLLEEKEGLAEKEADIRFVEKNREKIGDVFLFSQFCSYVEGADLGLWQDICAKGKTLDSAAEFTDFMRNRTKESVEKTGRIGSWLRKAGLVEAPDTEAALSRAPFVARAFMKLRSGEWAKERMDDISACRAAMEAVIDERLVPCAAFLARKEDGRGVRYTPTFAAEILKTIQSLALRDDLSEGDKKKLEKIAGGGWLRRKVDGPSDYLTTDIDIISSGRDIEGVDPDALPDLTPRSVELLEDRDFVLEYLNRDIREEFRAAALNAHVHLQRKAPGIARGYRRDLLLPQNNTGVA